MVDLIVIMVVLIGFFFLVKGKYCFFLGIKWVYWLMVEMDRGFFNDLGFF